MAIAAKRFEFLTSETNIAVSDFMSGTNISTLNSPNNQLKEITADIEEFLNSAVQIDDLIKPEMLDEAIRSTKDMSSNMLDTAGLSGKGLDGIMSSMALGNSQVSSLLGRMTEAGKGQLAGLTGGLDGMMPNMDFLGGAMDKLSGGEFSFDSLSPDTLLSSITSISTVGYDMGLDGVFGAMSTLTDDSNLLSKASSGILSNLSSMGNTSGIMDLVSSSVGLPINLDFPAAISSMTGSFNIPVDIKEMDFSSFSDDILGSFDVLDKDWSKSDLGDVMSISSISTKSDTLTKVFDSKVKNNIFGETDLNHAPDDDMSFMNTALINKKLMESF